MIEVQYARTQRPATPETHAEARWAEAQTRRSALVALRLGRRLGHGTRETARRIGTAPRTLRDWASTRRRHRAPPPRGRPAWVVDRRVEQDVRGFLALMGPRVSLDVLRAVFPEVPRAVLDRMRRAYRQTMRREKGYAIRALRWEEAGWVWAMDFTDAPNPIDGRYGAILLVRDLSSGKQLAALPLEHATAEAVEGLLAVLFARHGVPLVLKSDNGSAFREAELGAFARRQGVRWLYSPPSLPAYNGACEAGVGSLKTRAHHEAARHDRVLAWTCDDVEAARCQGNQTARPRGPGGPTPDEAFARRRMPSAAERHRFQLRCGELELAERQARGLSEAAELPFFEQASIDRIAIGRALVEDQILSFRRRRISLPFNSHSRANIS